MNKDDLTQIKKWFADYIATYIKDDSEYNRAIKVKEAHTMRVCRNIILLGNALCLPEHEMLLAETIGLLHDLGRFEQYAVYSTFNDMVSENHAKMGIQQIEKHKLLSMCTANEKRIITKAIAIHNAAKLPGIEDKKGEDEL